MTRRRKEKCEVSPQFIVIRPSSRAKIEIANYRRILSIDLVDQARCAQRLFALVKRIGRIN